MNVEVNNPKYEKVEFRNLQVGDFFCVGNETYIIFKSISNNKAVSLKTHKLTTVLENTLVTKLYQDEPLKLRYDNPIPF